MRSGRAYLTKRLAARRFQSFEQRAARGVPAPPPVQDQPLRADSEIPTPAAEEPRSRMRSELEEPQWSVVSFSGLAAGGLTYSQAVRLIDTLAESGHHGLCVITDAAALQID